VIVVLGLVLALEREEMGSIDNLSVYNACLGDFDGVCD